VSTDEPLIMFVRLRRGTVGETRRVVHLVPIPDPTTIPRVLTAYCRTRLRHLVSPESSAANSSAHGGKIADGSVNYIARTCGSSASSNVTGSGQT
jgi:hypothetical protein